MSVTEPPGAQSGNRGGPLVEIENLTKVYRVRSGRVITALRDISLTIERGETLGLVGESGCGKSTLARCLMGLETPTSGSIRFDGNQLVGLSRRQLRPQRRRFQIIFQNPTTSLNPRMTLKAAVAEPLRMHRSDISDPDRAAVELLQEVGLHANMSERRPSFLSGGQRQRVGIARAVAVQPDFLVLDEPTSSLDLSVRAQILLLLRRIQEQFGLTYLFISHDLGVIRQMADRVAVMYLGEIVEVASVQDAIYSPSHPYTAGLLAAVPSLESRPHGLESLRGEAVEPPHQGCPLHPRCPHAMDICRVTKPRLQPLGSTRSVACFLRHPPDNQEATSAGG